MKSADISHGPDWIIWVVFALLAGTESTPKLLCVPMAALCLDLLRSRRESQIALKRNFLTSQLMPIQEETPIRIIEQIEQLILK